MSYEVRYIEWVDSMGGSGWEPLEEMSTYKPMAIKTAGFVVAEGEDFVTVLQSYDERDKGRPHADNVISIPKVAITSMRTLFSADVH